MSITGYAEAIRHLYGLTRFGIKPDLKNTFRLAELTGNPQQRLRFVHVAGTNGKGSTCAMLDSICRNAGLRVGLYTSPHLVSFRERIQVDRELIPESDVVRLVTELQALCERQLTDLEPTFFEFVTMLALMYFAGRKCDLVILETGLGGRFDSTNIVEPLLCAITPISLDHQAWLGNTLPEIAAEKAGIIKPGVPVVAADQESEAMTVLRDVAAAMGSPFHECGPEQVVSSDLTGFPSSHRQNAALATKIAIELPSELGVTDQAVTAGLADVSWMGRFQRIWRGDQLVILDGAHNAAGFESLCEGLGSAGIMRPVLILSLLGDKDSDSIMDQIPGCYSRVLLVPIASARAGDQSELVAGIQARDVPVTECTSLVEALGDSRDEAEVVVAGSFYLIGEALELLGQVPDGVRSERALNEIRQ